MSNVVNRVIRKIRGKMPFTPGAVDMLSPEELAALERMLGAAMNLTQLKQDLSKASRQNKQQEIANNLESIVASKPPPAPVPRFTYRPEIDNPDPEPDEPEPTEEQLDIISLWADKFPSKAPQTRDAIKAALDGKR